jgi:hypothetical protein
MNNRSRRRRRAIPFRASGPSADGEGPPPRLRCSSVRWKTQCPTGPHGQQPDKRERTTSYEREGPDPTNALVEATIGSLCALHASRRSPARVWVALNLHGVHSGGRRSALRHRQTDSVAPDDPGMIAVRPNDVLLARRSLLRPQLEALLLAGRRELRLANATEQSRRTPAPGPLSRPRLWQPLAQNPQAALVLSRWFDGGVHSLRVPVPSGRHRHPSVGSGSDGSSLLVRRLRLGQDAVLRSTDGGGIRSGDERRASAFLFWPIRGPTYHPSPRLR